MGRSRPIEIGPGRLHSRIPKALEHAYGDSSHGAETCVRLVID